MDERTLYLLLILSIAVTVLIIGLRTDKQADLYFEVKRIGAIVTGIILTIVSLGMLIWLFFD